MLGPSNIQSPGIESFEPVSEDNLLSDLIISNYY